MSKLAVVAIWLVASSAAFLFASASVNSFLPPTKGEGPAWGICFLVEPSAGFYGCAGALAGLGVGLLLPILLAETQRELKRILSVGILLIVVGGPASSLGWLGPPLAFLGVGLTVTSTLGLLM